MLFPRIESVHPLRGACLRALKLGIQTDAKTRLNDKLLERICCAAIAHRISANHRSLRMWSRASSFERRRNSLERDKIGTAPRRMAPRALAEMPCARSCNSHEAAKCAAHRQSLS